VYGDRVGLGVIDLIDHRVEDDVPEFRFRRVLRQHSSRAGRHRHVAIRYPCSLLTDVSRAHPLMIDGSCAFVRLDVTRDRMEQAARRWTERERRRSRRQVAAPGGTKM
jgi:hypothetical protein